MWKMIFVDTSVYDTLHSGKQVLLFIAP